MNNKKQTKEQGPNETTGTPGGSAASALETVIVTVNGSITQEREAAVDFILQLGPQSAKYRELTGAINFLEGGALECLWLSYPETKAGKEEYEALLKSKGIECRMGARYRQLFKKVKGKLDLETRHQLEKAMVGKEEFAFEIVEKVADKVGRGKTMTDLMREVGILPKLETENRHPSGTPGERAKLKVVMVRSSLKKFYGLRAEMVTSGETESEDLREVFNAVDRALVVLGSYVDNERNKRPAKPKEDFEKLVKPELKSERVGPKNAEPAQS